MLDIRAIRENPEAVEARLQRRDPALTLAPVLAVDRRWRDALHEEETLKHRQNQVGPEIAKRKAAKADAGDLLAEMTSIKTRIQELAEIRRVAEAELEALLLELPNLPHDSVPVNPDKKYNQVVKTVGSKREFDFEPKHHVALAESLGLLDFERGAKVAGSGWPCYRGLGARLEFALISFCFDRGVRDGYEPIFPPLAVNEGVMRTAGVLPKFGEQVYIIERDDLYLVPTAEIVLTGLYADEIIDHADLPLKLMSYTPCFRREAGAHGANERGLIRIHQFNKTERYIICRPEDSYDHQDRLTAEVESLVAELGLHFVTTLLVTGDIAQQAAKTYDIEVWLPGQGMFLEVSSVSNCEDYQARRGKIRYRPAVTREDATRAKALLTNARSADGKGKYEDADTMMISAARLLQVECSPSVPSPEELAVSLLRMATAASRDRWPSLVDLYTAVADRLLRGLPLVHTLNGSALATSRLMAAILETGQQADGSVVVPEALRAYLGGLEVIEPR